MKLIRFRTLLILMLLTGCSAGRAFRAEPRVAGVSNTPLRMMESTEPAESEDVPEEFIQQVSHEESDEQSSTTEPAAAPGTSKFTSAVVADSPDRILLTDRSWTLKELEATADTLHPLLQRNQAHVESARGDALQAGLYPNPRFDTNNPQVYNGQNSVFNAGIMQEFVVKGKLRLDKAAATRVVQQNEFAYVQDRFMLMTMIRQQYYTVLAAERRLAVLRALERVTASSLKIGSRQEGGAGELAKIDVMILKVDNRKVQSELEKVLRLVRGARQQLSALVGDPSISNDRFDGSIYHSPPQFDEMILKQFATTDSAFVQIARLDIERNQFLLERAIAEPYPNVTLGPAYQWGLVQGNQQFWLTVTFPIPAWDRNQGNIISSQADVVAARKNLETVQLEQLRRVADAFSRHRSVRIQATKYEREIIPNIREAMLMARRGLLAGEYDFARFLQVQRTVVEANMDYIDILENVWLTAAELAGLLQLDDFLYSDVEKHSTSLPPAL